MAAEDKERYARVRRPPACPPPCLCGALRCSPTRSPSSAPVEALLTRPPLVRSPKPSLPAPPRPAAQDMAAYKKEDAADTPEPSEGGSDDEGSDE
jgi:hypothetical protein